MNRRMRGEVSLPAFAAATFVAALVVAQLPDSRSAPSGAPHGQVYAKSVPTLRFSHAKHADEACATCHGAALSSRRASDELRPAMGTCVGCHNEREEAPDISECGACHQGYPHREPSVVATPEQWRAVRPAPMTVPRAQAALRFDHAHHVPRLGGDRSCVACHAGAEPQMPTMASCTTCHDGTTAPGECTTCHPTGSNGKLRGARQSVDEPLRPDNHTVEFMKRHGAVAKSQMAECMACHVEEDCASCHNATFAAPFAVHPPNFVTIHAADARTNSGDCVDCHSVQTFCTSCHVRADVMTTRPDEPPARRQFHPAGWLESAQPNNHGVMARRDITECATCHTESDCISCHAGVNPHPPEFSLSCRRLLTANGASCAKCHSDLASLRALCP